MASLSMGVAQKPIDLVAAAERLPGERRAHLNALLNGGLFLSHTSADASFIRRHIVPTAVAEFYGAFFFQNQSFAMSEAYEPMVGQALLSCRVILIAVSAAAIYSRYMKAELDVSITRKMPAVVCRLDRTSPRSAAPQFAGKLDSPMATACGLRRLVCRSHKGCKTSQRSSNEKRVSMHTFDCRSSTYGMTTSRFYRGTWNAIRIEGERVKQLGRRKPALRRN